MSTSVHPSVQAERRPGHPAFIMGSTGLIVTYRDLDDRSNQAAWLLRSWGVDIGDGVAVLADNHPRYLELVWAAQRSGLYFTPISFHLTATEVAYILSDCAAKCVFVSATRAAMIPALRELLPSLRIVSLDGGVDGCEVYEQVVAGQPTHPIGDEAAGTDMLYTSGTTGMPKGVRRPLSQELYGEVPRRFRYYDTLGWDEETVHLSVGPLYHSSPLHTSMITQFFGGTNVVPGRFDAEKTLELIERHRVTHANMVPTHFVRLLRLAESRRRAFDLSSLQLVLHGAAPCPRDIKLRMIDWLGPIITEFYGGTEGLGGAYIDSHEWLEHPGSVGKSVLTPVHVVDPETGIEAPTGTEGTLYFENPPDFSYHNAPEKVVAMRSPQGWATLGDIGRLDEEGYIYIVDRRANLIISGGVNIYPQATENRLLLHPAVYDAAVFGIPSEEYGEDVHAVLELAAGVEPSDDLATAIGLFCRETLSPIKCPKSIEFTARLPRDENGKLYKRLLREQARAEADERDREHV